MLGVLRKHLPHMKIISVSVWSSYLTKKFWNDGINNSNMRRGIQRDRPQSMQNLKAYLHFTCLSKLIK
jgi:hypothetical protein